MELLLLMVRVVVWMARSSEGGGHTTQDPEECVRGQIIPC